MISREEWERRWDAAQPNTAQSRPSKSDKSQAEARHKEIEYLQFGIYDKARERLKSKEIAPEELEELLWHVNTITTYDKIINYYDNRATTTKDTGQVGRIRQTS